MDKKEGYTQLPVRDDHNCFACGPANPYGLHMRFSANEDTVISRLTVPEHLRGWNTMVHGGIISTILDEIMSWAAIHLLKSIIVTRSMTVEFKNQVHIGQELKAEGKVLEIVNRKEAIMEGYLYHPDGGLCASARGTFALLKPKVAVRLGVVAADELKIFLNDTD